MKYYTTPVARKMFGIRYAEGAKIPEDEFKKQPGLLESLLASDQLFESEPMDMGEALDFNDKSKDVEKKAEKVPDLQSMHWREAVDLVMTIKASLTLLKLQTQENARKEPRKSVSRAIDQQLRLYG